MIHELNILYSTSLEKSLLAFAMGTQWVFPFSNQLLYAKAYVQMIGTFAHGTIKTIITTASRKQNLFVHDIRNYPLWYVYRFQTSANIKMVLVVFISTYHYISMVWYVQSVHITTCKYLLTTNCAQYFSTVQFGSPIAVFVNLAFHFVDLSQ